MHIMHFWPFSCSGSENRVHAAKLDLLRELAHCEFAKKTKKVKNHPLVGSSRVHLAPDELSTRYDGEREELEVVDLASASVYKIDASEDP